MQPNAHELDLCALFALAVPIALPHVRVFRRNVLSVKKADGRRVRNGIKGQADFYAIVRGGGHLELEAKSVTGTLSPAQKRWRSFCLVFQVPHLVLQARPGELADDTIVRWVSELRTAVEAT